MESEERRGEEEEDNNEEDKDADDEDEEEKEDEGEDDDDEEGGSGKHLELKLRRHYAAGLSMSLFELATFPCMLYLKALYCSSGVYEVPPQHQGVF